VRALRACDLQPRLSSEWTRWVGRKDLLERLNKEVKCHNAGSFVFIRKWN
jgi:type II secretory pathway component PulJ